MAQVPTVKLNNGIEIPALGLGTWQGSIGDEKNEVAQAVKDAIDLGYRHFDCAHLYGNEKVIGDAIREKIQQGAVKRDELFIVSKLWNNSHRPDLVEPVLRTTLADLQVDRLDLYLMHWPQAFKEGPELNPIDPATGLIAPSDVDYVDTWKELERLYKKGLVRAIGVSNFNSKQLDRLLRSGITVVPAMNQIEAHPYLNQKKLRQYCRSKGIAVTAYAPLGTPNMPGRKEGDPDVFGDGKIKEIAAKYKKTPAQILLRYSVQSGMIPIPKSSNKNRLKENLDVFDFSLSDKDVEYIDTFDRNWRVYPFPECKNHPDHPFAEEF